MPAEARWDPRHAGFEWSVGAVDAEGRRHGTYRSWTRDGVLHGECDYRHGRVHGTNVQFHPDGTVASEADWANGVVMNSVFHRSAAPTTEPFAQAAPAVWSVRYYTRDGKTNYTIRYFSRDGRECGPDGNALPERPASVSADARWFPDIERWVDGEIERGTNARVGRWRWWSRAGVLRLVEFRDTTGEPSLSARYSATGPLEQETVRVNGAEQRDHYAPDGALATRTRTDARGRAIYRCAWASDGSIEHEHALTYDGDELAGVVECGAGGVRTFEARRDGASLACVLYAADGTAPEATGAIADGTLVGSWQLFAGGVLRRELDLTDLALEQAPTSEGLAWTLAEALFRTDEPDFVTPAELAGIDREPWAETGGAFDHDVEHFPRLVRGLISPDPQVRRFALEVIDGEIVQAGTTYPATARVIPHLAALLAHPLADPASLLRSLAAAGDAVTDGARDPATTHALAAAWPRIFACFAAAAADDRQRILRLAQLAPAAKSDVLALARGDTDASVRSLAIATVPALPGYTPSDLVALFAERDLLVRLVASLAVARTTGPDSPREVVHVLTEALRNWREVAARYTAAFPRDGHVLAAIASAAGAIHNADARSLARELCAALHEVDHRSAIAYADGLLALAFGRGRRPFAKRFVEILDTLARSTQLWLVETDARALLARWKLPPTQAQLAALVAELRGTSDPEARMTFL